MPIPIDTVLLKVTSRCNLDCSYCYIYNLGDDAWTRLPKRMSRLTLEATAAHLERLYFDQERHEFDVVLHGGEPLLLGEELEFFLTTLRTALPFERPICIQTNGTLISDWVLDVCERTKTTLSVSLDGPLETNDANRVDLRGASTHSRTIAGIERLKAHAAESSIFSGILAVIDPSSDPRTVYTYLKGLGAPSLDFLYRDGNHDRMPPGKSSPGSREYGSWLTDLFDFYVRDPAPVPIRILDDLVRLVLGGHGVKEGIGVTDYGIVVVDTDGSLAKNDTLKSSFAGADQFAESWSVFSTTISELAQCPEFSEYHERQRPSCRECRTCPLLEVCGGGMPVHRWHPVTGFDTPSVYCADQKHLINHVKRVVAEYQRSG